MLTPGWYRFFGWFFFVSTAPSVILHVIVLIAIYKIPSFHQRIALRLLFSMSIADCVQTVIHLISSVVTIINWEIPYHANIILGILIETFWEAMMFLQLGLGANRLYIVTRTTITREKEIRYFDWPVLLAWISSFVYTVLYWIGGRRLHYDIEFLGWPTAYTNGTLQTELTVWLYNGEMFFMCVGFVLCVLVIVVMGYKRRTKAVSARLANSNMEFRMLAQVSSIYMMSISNILLWNIFNEAPVEFQALLNFEWILICSLPPYLNILISSEIRRSVIAVVMPGYEVLFSIAPTNITRILPKPNSTIIEAKTHISRITTTRIFPDSFPQTKRPQNKPKILHVKSTLKAINEMHKTHDAIVSARETGTKPPAKKRVAFASTSTTSSSIKSSPM